MLRRSKRRQCQLTAVRAIELPTRLRFYSSLVIPYVEHPSGDYASLAPGDQAVTDGGDQESGLSEDSTPSARRRITFLPMYVEQGIQMTSQLFGWLPWQAVSFAGAAGTLIDEPDVRACIVGFEWPMQHFVTPGGISKSELERIHLERFRTDYSLMSGMLPFPEMQQTAPNLDPPDFTFNFESRREGLDCVQLVLPSRRRINGAFRVVRDAVLRECRERLSHLIGHVIYMWFHEADRSTSPRLPPRSLANEEIRKIVDALANYRIDPEAFTFDPSEHPDGMPKQIDPAMINFSDDLPGLTFYAMPMSQCVPNTTFFNQTGFELGMAYSTTDAISTIIDELVEKLISHDRPSTQHVLVTVGGPDRFGFTYPAEGYFAQNAFDTMPTLPNLVHIRQVILHFWNSGTVATLLPEFGISQPLFPGGYVPAAYHAETDVNMQPNMRYERFFVHEP